MRGMFTAGVLDVMMEQGLVYDGAVGVSAGAAFGCNYKSGQTGRAIRYNKRFCRDSRYCGLGSLLRTGDLYNTAFCYGEVPMKYDPFDFDAYERNPMRFYAVCTDVETGRPVYHEYTGREDHGFDWIRASASMPVVSRIVEIDGRKLLDGGIADPIPAAFFEREGYDRIVAVLTQPEGYRKRKSAALAAVRLKYGKYPRLTEAMAERHNLYNRTLAYIAGEERAGRIFVIRPPEPLPVKRTERNPDRLEAAYRIGRRTAEERMDALRRFLSAD